MKSLYSFFWCILILYMSVLSAQDLNSPITQWKLLSEQGSELTSQNIQQWPNQTLKLKLSITLIPEHSIPNNHALVCVVSTVDKLGKVSYLYEPGYAGIDTEYELPFELTNQKSATYILQVYQANIQEITKISQQVQQNHKINASLLANFTLLGEKKLAEFSMFSQILGVSQTQPIQPNIQPIANFPSEPISLEPFTNVIICVDESGSMLVSDPKKLRLIGLEIVTRLLFESGQKRLRVIPFADFIGNSGKDSLIPLIATDTQSNIAAITAILPTIWSGYRAPGNTTDIPLVLNAALDEFTKQSKQNIQQNIINNERNVIILISDGETNNLAQIFNTQTKEINETSPTKRRSIQTSIAECQKQGIEIYSIIVNPASILPGTFSVASQNLPQESQNAERFLQTISNSTGGKSYFLNKEQGFVEIFFDIFGRIGAGFVPSESQNAQYSIQVGVRSIILSSKGSTKQIQLPSGKILSLNLPTDKKELTTKQDNIELTIKKTINSGYITIIQRPPNIKNSMDDWVGMWQFLDEQDRPVLASDVRLAIFYDMILIPSKTFPWYYQYEITDFSCQLKTTGQVIVDSFINGLIQKATCFSAVEPATIDVGQIYSWQQLGLQQGRFIFTHTPFSKPEETNCWFKFSADLSGSNMLLGQTRIPFFIRPLNIPWKLDVWREKQWIPYLPNGSPNTYLTKDDTIRIYLVADPRKFSKPNIQKNKALEVISLSESDNFVIGTQYYTGYCLEAKITANVSDILIPFSMNLNDANRRHAICYPIKFPLKSPLRAEIIWGNSNISRYQNEIFNSNFQVNISGGTKNKRLAFTKQAKLIFQLKDNWDILSEKISLPFPKLSKENENGETYFFSNSLILAQTGRYTLSFLDILIDKAYEPDLVIPPPDSEIEIRPLAWKLININEPDQNIFTLVSKIRVELDTPVIQFHLPRPALIDEISNVIILLIHENGQQFTIPLDAEDNQKSQQFTLPITGVYKVKGMADIKDANNSRPCQFDLGEILIGVIPPLQIEVVFSQPNINTPGELQEGILQHTEIHSGVQPKLIYQFIVRGGDRKQRKILNNFLLTNKPSFDSAYPDLNKLHIIESNIKPPKFPLFGILTLERCIAPGVLVVNCSTDNFNVPGIGNVPVRNNPLQINIYPIDSQISLSKPYSYYIRDNTYSLSLDVNFCPLQYVYWDNSARDYWLSVIEKQMFIWEPPDEKMATPVSLKFRDTEGKFKEQGTIEWNPQECGIWKIKGIETSIVGINTKAIDFQTSYTIIKDSFKWFFIGFFSLILSSLAFVFFVSSNFLLQLINIHIKSYTNENVMQLYPLAWWIQKTSKDTQTLHTGFSDQGVAIAGEMSQFFDILHNFEFSFFGTLTKVKIWVILSCFCAVMIMILSFFPLIWSEYFFWIPFWLCLPILFWLSSVAVLIGTDTKCSIIWNNSTKSILNFQIALIPHLYGIPKYKIIQKKSLNQQTNPQKLNQNVTNLTCQFYLLGKYPPESSISYSPPYVDANIMAQLQLPSGYQILATPDNPQIILTNNVTGESIEVNYKP